MPAHHRRRLATAGHSRLPGLPDLPLSAAPGLPPLSAAPSPALSAAPGPALSDRTRPAVIGGATCRPDDLPNLR
ncbi:hypothetical protein Pen02_49890 [Plantactinospora endophytica]|uniref:Uncharacterized protein n=1 Tax=Plantactinospora endophytica TaxID=673535 RepID=A0ABQ4E5S0_9ACTN|nr:hypothetical protein Pen02_49890 [Plantactinospora endophytica]